MTPRQLAVAAAADIKWLINSSAILGRRLRYTASDAKWWGLVRLLTDTLQVTLGVAAAAATASLRPGSAGVITATADRTDSVALVIDLPRYESIFLANLSRALVHETPKRRGRPARDGSNRRVLDAALKHGVDLGLVRSSLSRSPAERLAMLEANRSFVRDMRRRGA
jgi:hypothetical protein